MEDKYKKVPIVLEEDFYDKMTDAFKKALEEERSLFSELLYKTRLPNQVGKFTVELAAARDGKILSDRAGGEGLFTYTHEYPSWYYLKILVKGDGTYTLGFVFADKATIDLESTEITKGDEIYLEWTDLKFTNTAQPDAESPVFWIEKRWW